MDAVQLEIPFCEILEHEDKKLCMDCWENKAFVDEDETDKDEGWCVCPTCKEKVGALCKSGLCVECDYKKQHPEAEKKICEDCIHFRYHDLYDETTTRLAVASYTWKERTVENGAICATISSNAKRQNSTK